MKLSRRSALGLIGSGAALPSFSAVAAAKEAVPGKFLHGVASGDPTAGGAILWTRVTPDDADFNGAIPLRWHVAASQGDEPLQSGEAHARSSRDFTVKVEPTGLEAGQDYVYWFELTDGSVSPTGRFRTLPRGEADKAVFAVVTCQLFIGGFYNAYDSLVKQDRVDAIIHLGDYIYEYGADGYGGEIGQKIGRTLEPKHEVVTLDDYRKRHAWYRSDPNLQAAHARAAFICVWDDHETANDSWAGGAQNHQPQSEGTWEARKAAALQAYFEWLPIRDPLPGDPWAGINRSFTFGNLATLMMVETRLLARAEQAGFKGEMPSAASLAAVLAEVADPDREMLGSPQRAWLEEGLAESVESGVPWQIIGNQVVMARVNGPIFADIVGPDAADAALAELDEATRKQVEASQAAFRAGMPFNLDAWDGYPAARERLYESFRRAGSEPLVLAGDSHAFWANNLSDKAGNAVGVEFGTSSISSPSIGDTLPSVPLGDLLTVSSPEVVFCDQRSKGYILLTLTADAAKADYVGMSTIYSPEYTDTVLASYNLDAKAKGRRLPAKG